MKNHCELSMLQSNANPQELEEIANIFYHAFKLKVHKIELFPKDTAQAIRLLAGCFIPGHVLLAIIEDKLVGMLAMDDDRGQSMKFSFSDLSREFGGIGGAVRYYWLNFISLIEKQPAGTLRIAAIAVAEEARGKGIGSLLLKYAEDFAQTQKYRALVLEVVDTNLRARSLYEKLGFIHTKTYSFGFITRHAGFSASDCMRKDLT
jgi:ribosomal protein S18 acetylase RimI-like enzyme